MIRAEAEPVAMRAQQTRAQARAPDGRVWARARREPGDDGALSWAGNAADRAGGPPHARD